jgi:FtsP/CotA-like multicopper oxidase with cupredoxin domain
MKGFIRTAVAGVLAAGALAQAAEAHQPKVPSDIAVAKGNKAFLDAHAVGVQIYSCNATATGHAWAFVAPRANLYDRGKLVATHFAGPTWQATDGSKVVGSRVNGVNVDPTAIDWLLLSAASTTPGRFGETTFIQRINTTGGLIPPAADCNAGTVGTQREVPYTADYVFWKKRRPYHGSED